MEEKGSGVNNQIGEDRQRLLSEAMLKSNHPFVSIAELKVGDDIVIQLQPNLFSLTTISHVYGDCYNRTTGSKWHYISVEGLPDIKFDSQTGMPELSIPFSILDLPNVPENTRFIEKSDFVIIFKRYWDENKRTITKVKLIDVLEKFYCVTRNCLDELRLDEVLKTDANYESLLHETNIQISIEKILSSTDDLNRLIKKGHEK